MAETGFNCTAEPYEDGEGLWNLRIEMRANDGLAAILGDRSLDHSYDLPLHCPSREDAELVVLRIIEAFRTSLPHAEGMVVFGPDGEPLPEG